MQYKASVPPNWDPLLNTIFSIYGSEKASMMAERYGVLLFLHGPGSLEVSGTSTRYFSAHWLTVRFSGGCHALRTSTGMCFDTLLFPCGS